MDPPERSQRPEVIVATRADGVSSLKFMPSALGPIAVTASVESDPSLVVSFTAEANGVLIAIQERQRGEYAIVAPDGSSTVTVPIRTPVEWASQTSYENHVWSDCPDRCPPGGEGFDRVLFPGQRLRFVPDVAGTWEYWAESTFFGILSTMGKLTAVVAG